MTDLPYFYPQKLKKTIKKNFFKSWLKNRSYHFNPLKMYSNDKYTNYFEIDL